MCRTFFFYSDESLAMNSSSFLYRGEGQAAAGQAFDKETAGNEPPNGQTLVDARRARYLVIRQGS